MNSSPAKPRDAWDRSPDARTVSLDRRLALQPSRDGHEQTVADDVPEAVVHHLESIQVEEQDARTA